MREPRHVALTRMGIILILGLWIAFSPEAGASQSERSGLHFVENCGQWPGAERFIQLGPGPDVTVAPGAFSLRWERDVCEERVEGVHLRFAIEGADPAASIRGEEQTQAKFHFLLGNDQSHWQTGLPGYRQVRMQDVRPDLDLVLHQRDGRVAYDLHLGSEADLSALVIRCQGGEGLRLDAEGGLLIDTALGTLRQTPPVSWLVREDGSSVPVVSRFRLLGGRRYGFEIDLESVPPDARLVIDPGLEWSTFLATRSVDRVRSVVIDGEGQPIITGPALDRNFPTTPGAYSRELNAADAYVTKFNVDGSSLIFSTFLGGSGGELGIAQDLQGDGSIIIGGTTSSMDFPVTPDAAQPKYAGASDSFVARLSRDGSALLYAT